MRPPTEAALLLSVHAIQDLSEASDKTIYPAVAPWLGIGSIKLIEARWPPSFLGIHSFGPPARSIALEKLMVVNMVPEQLLRVPN
jgi:hypothetical protein